MSNIRRFRLTGTTQNYGVNDWRNSANTPPNTWVKIAGGSSFNGAAWQKGATVANVGVSGVGTGIYAYGGSSVDASGKRMFLFGGGHGDYYGNETYALNLNQAVPAWELFKGRSPGPYPSNQLPRNFHGQYPDDYAAGNGWPISHHNSGSLVQDGRFWHPLLWGVFAISGNTTQTSAIFSLDLATREWAKHGKGIGDTEYAAYSWGSWEGLGNCAVPWLNEIWQGIYTDANGATAIYCINTLTGAISRRFLRSLGYGLLKGQYVAVPPKGSRPGFIVGFRWVLYESAGKLMLVDPTNAQTYGVNYATYPTAIPFTNSWAGYNHLNGDGFAASTSLMYWPQGDCLLYANPTPNGNLIESLLRINIPQNVTSMAQLAAATWTASRFDPANIGAGPVAASYISRSIGLIPDMGDGDAALVFTKPSELFTGSGLNAPVYVMRLRNA